jgi:hypothetical protein
MKGKLNIYSQNGAILFSIQGLINISDEDGVTVITYQEDNSKTMTMRTNMPYIYWQD